MKAVVSKLICVALIGPIVCLTAISNARPQSDGTVELNEIASTFAMELIKRGDVLADGKGAWTEHRPSAGQENEFIRVYGFTESDLGRQQTDLCGADRTDCLSYRDKQCPAAVRWHRRVKRNCLHVRYGAYQAGRRPCGRQRCVDRTSPFSRPRE